MPKGQGISGKRLQFAQVMTCEKVMHEFVMQDDGALDPAIQPVNQAMVFGIIAQVIDYHVVGLQFVNAGLIGSQLMNGSEIKRIVVRLRLAPEFHLGDLG